MSTDGHWFDPETAEQYLEAMDALQSRAATAYDQVVKQDLQQIEAQLEEVVEDNEGLAAETQRQLREIVGLVGRFKSQTATALLGLEQEIKQVRESMAKAVKERSELEDQKLDIEKSKLKLERWKVVIGIVVVFLTGLLFPIVLWQLGIKP